MLVNAVIKKLHANGFDRVEGAAEMQGLIARGALPSAAVTLFVVPLGMRGGDVRSVSGQYIQDTKETIAVFIAIREIGPAATRALETLDQLLDRLIEVIAGWLPEGAQDVFRLLNTQLISFVDGVVLYQVDFSTQSQLRFPR